MNRAAIGVNPFPGLRPFEEADAIVFFGREQQADELLDRLARSRFVAVVGTSASGKSSLVRAGLLPALHGGFMAPAGSRWRIATFRPGNDPIGALARELVTRGIAAAGGEDVALGVGLTRAVLERGEFGIVEVVQQAGLRDGENVLIVADQFEELFRFRQHRDDAAAFVKLLIAAARCPDPVYVLITMRSDFLGECSQFRDLPETINEGIFLVPRLTRDQLREAIEGPVGVAGAEISSVLVNRLLNELGDSPDQLPVLQHALMRSWDIWKQRGDVERPIDAGDFDDTGGLNRALSRHGDETYDALAPALKPVAERVFKALTDRGSDHRGIRRPTPFGELVAIARASPEEVREVIDAFRAPGRSFLMPPTDKALTDTTVVDISHESLMRVWERLRQWVDEEAAATQEYRRLSDAAQRHARGVAALLIDPELTIAANWKTSQDPTPAWAAHALATTDEAAADPENDYRNAIAFLEKSIAARDAVERDREEAERRERAAAIERVEAASTLALERTKAEASRRIERRTRVAALVLLVLAVLASAAGAASLWQGDKARQAETQERIAAGLATVASEKARLAAIDARNNATSAKLSAAEALRQKQAAIDNGKKAQANAILARTAEGRALAEAATLKQQTVQLAQQKTQLETLGRARELERERVFLEAGRRALVDDANVDDAALYLGAAYRLQPGDQDAQILLPQALHYLAMRQAGGTIQRQDAEPPNAAVADVDRAQTARLRYDPVENRRTIAVTYGNGEVVLWDASGKHHRTLQPLGSNEAVTGVSWDPSGRYLAAGGDAGSVAIVDVAGANAAVAQRRMLQQGRVNSIAFSGDGRHLVTAGSEGRIIVWESASGKPLFSWNVDAAGAVFAGTNSAAVIVAQSDGTLARWDLHDDSKRKVGGTASSAFVNVVSAQGGRYVAAAAADGTVVVYDSIADKILATITDSRSPINAIEFDPTGQRIITGRRNGSAHVYDVNGTVVSVLARRGAPSVVGVAIDRGNTSVLTTDSDGALAIWSLTGGQQIARFRGLPRGNGSIAFVQSADFSPDGKTIGAATDTGFVLIAPGDWLLTRAGSGRGAVESSSFDRTGTHVLTTHADGETVLWRSASDLRKVSVLEQANGGGPVFEGRFSGNSRRLLTVSGTAARVWTIDDEAVHPFRTIVPTDGKRFTDAAFALDDRAILTVQNRATPLDTDTYKRNRWLIWELDGTRAPLEENSYGPYPRQFQFSTDGRYALELETQLFRVSFRQLPSGKLATVDRGGLNHIYGETVASALAHDYRRNGYAIGAAGGTVNLVTFGGKRRRIAFPSQGDVGALAFSDDDRWLAVFGRGDKVVKIVDTVTTNTRTVLHATTTDVRSIGFSPGSGELIVTVNADGAARLWNRHTGALLGVRWLPGAAITTALFDPVQNRVLFGGSDGGLYVWTYREAVEPDDVAAIVHRVDSSNPGHVCLLDQAIAMLRGNERRISAMQCE